MSLRTVGYSNGRPIRIDEGPAVAEPREWYRGQLVVGGDGPNDRDRLNEYQRKSKRKLRALRAAAA